MRSSRQRAACKIRKLLEDQMSERHAKELRTLLALWEELIEHWALDADEEAGLLGGASFAGRIGDIASWHASSMEQRMRLLIELGSLLDDLLSDHERIRRWLRRRQPSLRQSPIDAMSSSVEWLHWLRHTALSFAAHSS